jgi:hypothetical protein
VSTTDHDVGAADVLLHGDMEEPLAWRLEGDAYEPSSDEDDGSDSDDVSRSLHARQSLCQLACTVRRPQAVTHYARHCPGRSVCTTVVHHAPGGLAIVSSS